MRGFGLRAIAEERKSEEQTRAGERKSRCSGELLTCTLPEVPDRAAACASQT